MVLEIVLDLACHHELRCLCSITHRYFRIFFEVLVYRTFLVGLNSGLFNLPCVFAGKLVVPAVSHTVSRGSLAYACHREGSFVAAGA